MSVNQRNIVIVAGLVASAIDPQDNDSRDQAQHEAQDGQPATSPVTEVCMDGGPWMIQRTIKPSCD